MRPIVQRLWHRLTTTRTVDCSSVRPDAFNDATGTFSLVGRVVDQLVPRGVVDGFGEHPGCQPFDVQVLERDMRKAGNEARGQLVREVLPLVRGPGIMPGEPQFCFLALPTATLAAGQGALQPTLALGG
jgi:hypothetical protein